MSSETPTNKHRPAVIFINGPVAAGKTTIAQRYIDEHPLALLLSLDDFVGSMGQWLEHEDEAHDLAFAHLKLVAAGHLQAGYNVVIPYLLIHPDEAAMLESVARSAEADFFEFVLVAPKDEMIQRALARGTWGEPGSPPLTEQDAPIVEQRYDQVTAALAARPQTIRIDSINRDIDGTYLNLKQHLIA